MIDSDSNSSSSSGSPERHRAGKERKKTSSTHKKSEETKKAVEDYSITEDVEMVKVPPVEEEKSTKTKIVLPPREEWPPVIRPALQGKVRILEDRLLEGHKITIVNKNKKEDRNKTEATSSNSVLEGKTGEAHSFMEQLTPLLNKWLQENVMSLGVAKADRRAEVNRKGPKDAKAKDGRNKTASSLLDKPQGDSLHPKEGGNSGRPQRIWSCSPQWWGGRWRKESPPLLERPRVNRQEGRLHRQHSGGRSRVRFPVMAKRGPTSGEPPPRKRPPRTAAVTLTCPPDQYARAMRVAREKINLEDLGINTIKPRRAATGGLVLEISGPDGKEKAISLKEKMEEALQDMEGVRVRSL